MIHADHTSTWPTAYLIHGTAHAEYGPVTDYFVRSLNGTYTTIGGGQYVHRSGPSTFTNVTRVALVDADSQDRLRAALDRSDAEVAAATRALIEETN